MSDDPPDPSPDQPLDDLLLPRADVVEAYLRERGAVTFLQMVDRCQAQGVLLTIDPDQYVYDALDLLHLRLLPTEEVGMMAVGRWGSCYVIRDAPS